ncbi:MAG: hypothetical protein RLZZ610_381 [Actinomycetota bacterium]|jgi:DNA-binding NarL/FixJ family response regulator
MKQIRIALLDSDSDTRSGRKLLLGSIADFEIVFESNGSVADLNEIENALIDVLVVDQRLSSGAGVAFLQKLRQRVGSDQTPNALLTCSFEQPTLRLAAIEAGICQVVALEEGPEKLVQSIRETAKQQSNTTLFELFNLISSQNPPQRTDLNFVRMFDELPDKSASSFEKLRVLWQGADRVKLEQFKMSNLESLAENLPVKTIPELIVRIQTSGLFDGE